MPDSCARSQVLQLQDLIEHILLQLPSSDLQATLLVNKLFHQISVRVLYGSQSHGLVISNAALGLALVNNTSKQTYLKPILKNISITRATSTLLSILNVLAPHLRYLTITPSAWVPCSALALLLPFLKDLVGLKILSQDLRTTNRPRNARRNTRPPSLLPPSIIPDSDSGTDKALITLARCRVADKIPGLHSLTIAHSPDLTNAGISEYLELVGESLLNLELSSCAALTAQAFESLVHHASNLRSMTLKDLDLVTISPPADPSPSNLQSGLVGIDERYTHEHCDALWTLLDNCQRLHTLVIADVCGLSFSRFHQNPLQLPRNTSLTTLRLSCLPTLTASDLCCFPHVQTLSISNCVNLSCLPVKAGRGMPELRQISLLMVHGIGMTVHNFYDLMILGSKSEIRRDLGKRGVRKCVVDTIPVAFPAPLVDHPDADYAQFAATPQDQIPAIFQPYLHRQILDPAVPGYLVANLLARAEELESIWLYGMDKAKRLSRFEVTQLLRDSRSLLSVNV